VVDGLIARGGVGLEGILGSHGALEGVTSNDAVHVGTGNARVDDGVCSLKGEGRAVDGKGITSAGNKGENTEDQENE